MSFLKSLATVKFPVYKLRTHYKIVEEDGIVYISSYSGIYILDNKNLFHDSLSERRLHIKDQKSLYKLKSPLYTFGELVRAASPSQKFIDSSGRIFSYKKSRTATVEYFRLIKLGQIEGKGYLVKAVGRNFRVLLNSNMYRKYKYVGLIFLDGGYLVYEFCDEEKKTCRRRI